MKRRKVFVFAIIILNLSLQFMKQLFHLIKIQQAKTKCIKVYLKHQ